MSLSWDKKKARMEVVACEWEPGFLLLAFLERKPSGGRHGKEK